MASTRPVSGDGGEVAGLLGSAAALRWSRPDLTGSIADHVLELAAADADDSLWLRAAGWVVYARSATGDGRGVACDVLDGVARRGAHVLDESAADRLRVELAALATGANRLAVARTLLTPVAVADTAPELRADALCALSRCAVEDRPVAVEGLLRRVDATWAEVGGRRGHIGTAAASLVAATAERRAGRPAAAVERAAAGLASLESARGSRAQSPSRHLAAGLAAEWLSGLLDAGRLAEAREGCVPVEPRLRDTSRPSRQIALLRLTVARTMAGAGAAAVVEAVAQAARDAVASDAPDLEAVCSSTLGALQKKSAQHGESLESTRRGEAARRRDEDRARRFQAALDALVSADTTGREPDRRQAGLRTNGNGGFDGARHRTDAPADTSAWTDWSSAVARDRTVLPPNPADIPDHGSVHRVAGAALSDGPGSGDVPRHDSTGNGANGLGGSNGIPRTDVAGNGIEASRSPDPAPEIGSPWQDWTEDSPIGRLLARSLQAGETAEQPVQRNSDGARRPRRYPDAVTDPWSTGSWSTGHWAVADQSAGRGSNGSTGPERAADDPPAARGGRRRRADPDDEFTTVAPPKVPGVDQVDQDGAGSSRWAGGSARHHAGDELLARGDTQSGRGRSGAGRDAGAERSGRGATGWTDGGWATSERAVFEPAAERGSPHERPAGGRTAADRDDSRRAAAARAAAERAAAERAAAERAAAERIAASRAAAERLAAERAESELRASERAASERAAAERLAAEQVTAERAAAERAAAENSAADRAAADRAAADQAAADSAAADRAADRAVEPGSSSWLQNALAELDRALAASAPVDSRQAAPAPEAEGCVVVVDLARDGRRFAGRRAGSVIRALAERLADRLPVGARLRHDDSDALSVVLPGWSRSPATEWMHRTLPGLFEEFVTDEDLPGRQLRAAVHDTDGPVGAQLLQRLDSPGRARSVPDPLVPDPLAPDSLAPDPLTDASHRPSTTGGGGRRHRRAAEEDRPERSAGNGSGAGRPDPAADTDGLGLADLLAGALAAYRGI